MDVCIVVWFFCLSVDEVKVSVYDVLMCGIDLIDLFMKFFSVELGEATSGVEAACYIVDWFGKDWDYLKLLLWVIVVCYVMGYLIWKEC